MSRENLNSSDVMTTYLVFGGPGHYPRGGILDALACFEVHDEDNALARYEEAKTNALSAHPPDIDWFQLVSVRAGEYRTVAQSFKYTLGVHKYEWRDGSIG